MANITITPGALSTGENTTITLNTKDTYVLEDIDVVVAPQHGSFNNQATTGTEYTENTSDSTIIPSGGFLYLNKGWFDDTKISLGHLIPEIASNDAGVSHILTGYKAYDENGAVITGTMAIVNPEFDGGTLSVTPTVKDLVDPKVSVSSSGTFKNATNYGVTSSKPTGTDGTNYLKIDGSASVDTQGSVKAHGSATRGEVLYKGAYTGYIDKADNTQALRSESTAVTSNVSSIGVTITDSFDPLYIPIVSVSGKGGGLTKSSSGNSFSIDGVNPTMTLSYSGKFTETVGASYGVVTSTPTGTDGTEFLSLKVDGSSDTQTFSGEASIKVIRAAVTNDGLKRGAINIADGASLLSETSATFEHNGSVNVEAELSGERSYYIPIIKTMPVSGGGMTQGASSVTITGNEPTVTINKSGKFTEIASGGVGASYGVTATAPTTGTDGTDFLKIDISGTSNSVNFTSDASILVNRGAVSHSSADAGAIKWDSGAIILTSTSKEFTETNTKSVSATVSGGASYYIPIVNLTDKGTGGVVTASATADVEIDKPRVDYSISGSVIGDSYAFGISHTQYEGVDGDEYYSLIIEPNTLTQGSVSGTVSGNWSRTAVKSNNTYKGAVSLTTSTQFLSQGSGTFDGTEINETNIGVDFASITDEDRKWYFKRARLSSNGGDLEDADLNVTGTAPTVTPDISFLSRTGSTNGSEITVADYGITTTAPTSGNWVVFDPTGNSNNATFTGRVTAARSNVDVSVTNGLTTGESGRIDRTTKTYTGSKTFKATVGNGTNRYIPVQTVSASVASHSVTAPTVDYSETAKYFINGTAQSSVPSGIILAQSSNPSDFSSSSYIQIIPSESITNGSSTTTAKGTISAGITTGGNDTESSTQSVGVTGGTRKTCFIKVYNGSYTVS